MESYIFKHQTCDTEPEMSCYYFPNAGITSDVISTNMENTHLTPNDRCRHGIFPEFSGIPEFSRPQRSFLWKSQIRFNIYGEGGGGTIYSVCSLSVSNAGTAHHKSSQASGVYTMSIFTSRPIYYNSLIFCIVRVCTSLLIFKLSYVTLKQ